MKKILLADDEKDLIETVSHRLEANNYSVIVACDGQEALHKTHKEKPDLIILDLMLPKVDGLWICELLKRDQRYAKIPVLMLTARTGESDIKTGKECGADAYITKPFEPQELLAKIKELLKE